MSESLSLVNDSNYKNKHPMNSISDLVNKLNFLMSEQLVIKAY